MGEAIAFYTLAAFILGFAVLVVTTKDTVHSVLFLVLDFLFVAALYVMLGAQFLAAIQILVYAGRHRRPVPVRRHAGEPEAAGRGPCRSATGEASSDSGCRPPCSASWRSSRRGATPRRRPQLGSTAGLPASVTGNTEQVGWMLYTSYLIPFEIASMLLLVAMIGAIVLAKREL